METNLSKYLRKTIETLTYIFVFFLPWQIKLILRSGETNYSEISFYFSHALLLLILSLFVWFRIREKSRATFNSPIFYSLASLSIFFLISIALAPDKALAFFHYFVFLVALSLFFVVRAGTEPRNYQEIVIDKIKLVYYFLGSLFLHSLLAIYQFLNQSSFASKFLGLAVHNPSDLGTAVVETASGRWLRAYGGFDHPNILGGVLVVALILSAYLLAKKKILNNAKQVWISIFLFAFYFIALYALFFSFSRSAWVALLVGLVILLVILIKRFDKWVVGRLVALIFFSSVLIALVAAPFRELVTTRLEANTRLEQVSIYERHQYMIEASELLRHNFISGVGIGNYQVASSLADGHKKSAWEHQPVHNVFLLLFVQSGIFALISFLLFGVFLLKYGRREKFAFAIVAAIVVLMMFDHWLLSLPFGVLFLFLVLALI